MEDLSAEQFVPASFEDEEKATDLSLIIGCYEEELARQNLVDYIPWAEYTPNILREKIFYLMENAGLYHDAISRFKLTGIESMQRRLNEFRCKRA